MSGVRHVEVPCSRRSYDISFYNFYEHTNVQEPVKISHNQSILCIKKGVSLTISINIYSSSNICYSVCISF